MFFAKKVRYDRTKIKHSLQGQETCFEALRKGVLTVELALVMPLFLSGVLTLVCFMDVLRIQTEQVSHLCEKAMDEGMRMYMAGEERPVVDITETRTYRLPVSVVPLPGIVFAGRGRVHSWIGADRDETAGAAEEMVYMAASGNVYHTDPHCSYVDLSVRQAAGAQVESLRNDYGARYGPCGSCSRGEEPAQVVYITGKGSRYHNQMNCSRLKRNVRLVPISEAAGRPLCSRCRRMQR